MNAEVKWDLDRVAASAQEILDAFRRDALNQAKETCEVCRRDAVSLREKLSQQPCGNLSIRSEFRSDASSAVCRFSNPASEHHSLYDRANLLIKLVVTHVARILHLTRHKISHRWRRRAESAIEVSKSRKSYASARSVGCAIRLGSRPARNSVLLLSF